MDAQIERVGDGDSVRGVRVCVVVVVVAVRRDECVMGRGQRVGWGEMEGARDRRMDERSRKELREGVGVGCERGGQWVRVRVRRRGEVVR